MTKGQRRDSHSNKIGGANRQPAEESVVDSKPLPGARNTLLQRTVAAVGLPVSPVVEVTQKRGSRNKIQVDWTAEPDSPVAAHVQVEAEKPGTAVLQEQAIQPPPGLEAVRLSDLEMAHLWEQWTSDAMAFSPATGASTATGSCQAEAHEEDQSDPQNSDAAHSENQHFPVEDPPASFADHSARDPDVLPRRQEPPPEEPPEVAQVEEAHQEDDEYRKEVQQFPEDVPLQEAAQADEETADEEDKEKDSEEVQEVEDDVPVEEEEEEVKAADETDEEDKEKDSEEVQEGEEDMLVKEEEQAAQEEEKAADEEDEEGKERDSEEVQEVEGNVPVEEEEEKEEAAQAEEETADGEDEEKDSEEVQEVEDDVPVEEEEEEEEEAAPVEEEVTNEEEEEEVSEMPRDEEESDNQEDPQNELVNEDRTDDSSGSEPPSEGQERRVSQEHDPALVATAWRSCEASKKKKKKVAKKGNSGNTRGRHVTVPRAARVPKTSKTNQKWDEEVLKDVGTGRSFSLAKPLAMLALVGALWLIYAAKVTYEVLGILEPTPTGPEAVKVVQPSVPKHCTTEIPRNLQRAPRGNFDSLVTGIIPRITLYSPCMWKSFAKVTTQFAPSALWSWKQVHHPAPGELEWVEITHPYEHPVTIFKANGSALDDFSGQLYRIIARNILPRFGHLNEQSYGWYQAQYGAGLLVMLPDPDAHVNLAKAQLAWRNTFEVLAQQYTPRYRMAFASTFSPSSREWIRKEFGVTQFPAVAIRAAFYDPFAASHKREAGWTDPWHIFKGEITFQNLLLLVKDAEAGCLSWHKPTWTSGGVRRKSDHEGICLPQ